MSRLYVFTWAGPFGPCARRFASVSAFDGYVAEWRRIAGAVVFDSPQVARGALQ